VQVTLAKMGNQETPWQSSSCSQGFVMITDYKITEIFYYVDEFCKVFDK